METEDEVKQQQGAVPAEAELKEPVGGPQLGMMWVAAISTLVSVLVALLAVVGFKVFDPIPKIVTVNLSEVVQIKEVQLAAMASRPGVSDRERAGIYDEIAVFGKQMEDALQGMESDCNCIILVRPAVVKGAQDVTEGLKQRVGLGGVTLPAAVAEWRSSAGSAMPAQSGSEGPGATAKGVPLDSRGSRAPLGLGVRQ